MIVRYVNTLVACSKLSVSAGTIEKADGRWAGSGRAKAEISHRLVSSLG